MVAVPVGPPTSPVSRNVTVAVREASVSLAAKLTVTFWLFIALAGATEVNQAALVVVDQAQFVPPVFSPNVAAEAVFGTLRVEGGPTVNEQAARCVIG